MPSVTSTPLCTVKGCPAPSNPDWHIPWCGHGLEGQHHHVIKRSRGGKGGYQVFLCHDCHDIVDNGYKWGNGVFKNGDGAEVYLLWDVAKGIEHPLIERLVADSAAAESGKVNARGGQSAGSAQATGPAVPAADVTEGLDDLAAAPSASGVSAGAEAVLAAPGMLNTSAQGGSSAPALTHERCMALTAEIRDTQRNRQWRAGDLGNLFIKVLGEQADQYICDFGFAEPTIANILKVCEAITLEERHDDVSFGHCAVYYKKNREDRDMWRDVVLAEGVTVRALREQVHGVKPEPMGKCPECGHEAPRSEFHA